jgi:hypothetical protein
MAAPTAAVIADAVVTELTTPGNGPDGSWPLEFDALRSWLPLLSLGGESGLTQIGATPRLSVVADSMPVDDRLTRTLQHQEYEVYLLLQAKVQDETPESIDPLAGFLETVKDWFFADQHQLAGVEFVCRCIAAAVPTWCWRPHLEMFVYTGVIQLTFEVDQ